MGRIWNSMSNYFGDRKAPDVPIVDVESTTQWQASLLNFPSDDGNKKLAKFVFKISLAAAEGIVTREQIDNLVKRYRKNDKTPVDISLLTYTLSDDFSWHLWFYHRHKTDCYIGWREWSKKSEAERAEYFAFFDYGIKGAKKGGKKGAPDVYRTDLTEDVPEDKDRFEVVYNTFFDLAKVCLGVKFKEDKDEILAGEPEFDKDNRLPPRMIGVDDEKGYFGIIIEGNMPFKRYKELSVAQQTEFLEKISRLTGELQKITTGFSRYTLGASKTSGPEESDFDLLRKAFDLIQQEPGCREGYADSGKAMVSAKEADECPIADLIVFMKVSGDYTAVLEKYQELKDSPVPDPAAPAPATPAPATPGPTTPPTAPAPVPAPGPAGPAPVQAQPAGPIPFIPTCQTMKLMYQGFRDKVGDLADERYPSHWDAVFGKKFADDRGQGKFGQLSYIKVSVFDLINTYIDTNRSTSLPNYLEDEANRLFAEAVQQQAQP